MKIHEYQGKQIFAKYGIPVPKGYPAFSTEEAESAAKRLIDETGMPVVVVKAQIHAGGRGKGGGVKLAKNGPADAAEIAEQILGMQLVTHQTGPKGQKVRRLYIEQGLDIARELYLGMVVDREKKRIAIMASTEGGMDIEEVAAQTPEKILTEHIDPLLGLGGYQARKLAYASGRAEARQGDGHAVRRDRRQALYELFVKEDCSLLEINPLVVTKKGNVIALDAKINFDDNAEFRHPEWDELRDADEEDPVELEAKEGGPLLRQPRRQHRLPGQRRRPGDVHHGHHQILRRRAGELPGRGRRRHQRAGHQGLQDHPHSPKVKGIFVNIFGGIMKCDVIAERRGGGGPGARPHRALVVRLEGTNVELGKKILEQSGLTLVSATTMADGAQKIVELARRLSECTRTMAILVNKDTRVLVVQGITGSAGGFHAKQCIAYGTQVVAGCTPGRGGETFEAEGPDGKKVKIPVFDTVAEAVKQTGANTSLIFVPPPGAADAILEAADAGLPLVVSITEGIPVLDMAFVKDAMKGSKTCASSARTAPASSRRANARSASCPATSTSPAASAWSAVRAPSPTRPSASSRRWASARAPASASAATR